MFEPRVAKLEEKVGALEERLEGEGRTIRSEPNDASERLTSHRLARLLPANAAIVTAIVGVAALLSSVLRDGCVAPRRVRADPDPATPRGRTTGTEASTMATDPDIRRLRADLRAELRAELRSELRSSLRSELRAELRSDLRSELRSDLRSELAEHRRRTQDAVSDLERRIGRRIDLLSEDSDWILWTFPPLALVVVVAVLVAR